MELERIAKLEAQVDAIKDDVCELKDNVKDLHSRITTGNREIMDKLDTKIDELAKNDKEQHESLKKSMDNVKERVDLLEKWRWMIVGGAIAVGYVMGHTELFGKFFK
jgi:ElaB/YqjD/DUF883 family membrane-anchored ribosome-binding protein